MIIIVVIFEKWCNSFSNIMSNHWQTTELCPLPARTCTFGITRIKTYTITQNRLHNKISTENVLTFRQSQSIVVF